jgi:hypothetical protein
MRLYNHSLAYLGSEHPDRRTPPCQLMFLFTETRDIAATRIPWLAPDVAPLAYFSWHHEGDAHVMLVFPDRIEEEV